MEELGKTVAVISERVDTLQQLVLHEQRRLNGNLERLDQRLAGLNEKLDTVRIQTLTKPSWGVTVIITALVGLVSALATWALTR